MNPDKSIESKSIGDWDSDLHHDQYWLKDEEHLEITFLFAYTRKSSVMKEVPLSKTYIITGLIKSMKRNA